MNVDEFVLLVKAKVDGSVRRAEAGLGRMQTVAMGAARGLSVAAGALAGLTAAASLAADEAIKGSRRIGVTVEEYQRLGIIADRAGASISSITTAARTLSRAADEAAQGTAEYAEVFDRLGVDVTGADGKLRSFSDLLPEVLERLKATENETERLALAQQILGRGAQSLSTLIEGGADGFREAERRAKALGYQFDEGTARAAERLNDNVADLSMSVEALAFRAVAPLIPLVSELSDDLVTWWMRSKQLIDAKLDRYVGGLVRGFRALTPQAKAAITVLSSAAAAAGIVRMGGALGGMFNVLTGGLAGKAVASLRALALPLLGLAVALLAVEDVLTFARGGDSLTGRLLRYLGGEEAEVAGRDALTDLTDLLGSVADALEAVASAGMEGAADAFESLADGVAALGESIGLNGQSIRDFFSWVGSYFEVPDLTESLRGMSDSFRGAASGFDRLGEAMRGTPEERSAGTRALVGAVGGVLSDALMPTGSDTALGRAAQFAANPLSPQTIVNNALNISGMGLTAQQVATLTNQIFDDKTQQTAAVVGSPPRGE